MITLQPFAELKDAKGIISYHKNQAADATKSQSKGTANSGTLAIQRRESDQVRVLRSIPDLNAEWSGENLGKDRQVSLKNKNSQGQTTRFELTFGEDWQIAQTLMDGQAVDFQKWSVAPGSPP